MDINYHYFTVKVLAVKAGFAEADAQVIASYSQFVDDFDIYNPIYFEDVPDFARYLAVEEQYDWIFYPVTTGFTSFFDYARLDIEQNRRRILIPFHFITKDPITVIKKDRKEYRVKPVTVDGESLLNTLLAKACTLYRQTPNRENTIRIGVLLHIFADTYAHQRFSGFRNWENHAFLTFVKDNRNGNIITSSYWPISSFYAPSIGHANVNTAPDDSNVSFTMVQKYDSDGSYIDNYSRNNTAEFLIASREIFNYLRSCLGKEKIDDASWRSLAGLLERGLLTSSKDIPSLKTHWSTIFPDIIFAYDKTKMMAQGVQLSPKANNSISNEAAIQNIFDKNSDPLPGVIFDAVHIDFFYFNVIADSIRRAVDPSFDGDEDLARHTAEIDLKKNQLGKEIFGPAGKS